MIRSYYVEGYKGLKSVSLSDLSRINLIVGQSSSGKTALLESIKIGLSGNPGVMWNTSTARGGIQFLPAGSNSQQFESSWRQFFSDFDSHGLMRFWMKDDADRNAMTTAFFDRDQVLNTALQSGSGSVEFISFNPLVFDRTSFTGENSRLTVKLEPSMGLQFDQGPELGIPSEVLPSSGSPNIIQIANWFSALSIEDKEHDIISTVCEAFPTISGLSVQSPQGYAQLYATLKSINRKLPITSISSGITKFVSIILAMTVYQGGVLIIDEIENGIYYKSFPTMWKTILEYSAKTNTQVFASTHSWECLSAAASEFDHSPEVYSLLQVSNRNGETIVSSVTGFDATNAIEGNIEVRR